MKKLLLFVCLLLTCIGSYAYDAEIDGIYYTFTDTEASVVSGDNKYSGEVVIPDSVTYNGQVYPVTTIRLGAFRNCNEMTALTIPVSVKSIQSSFSGCTNLTTVTLTLKVAATEEESTVTYRSGKPRYCNISLAEGLGNIFGQQVTQYILAEGSNRIPENTFYDCRYMESVTIPEGVSYFGSDAFYNCSSLTSLYIPGSVRGIAQSRKNYSNGFFYHLDALESIVVSKDNPYYDSRSNCNAIILKAYNILILGCNTTVIPDGVWSIESEAFMSRANLSQIVIPNTVQNIGDNAFSACKNVSSITLGTNTRYIGGGAFAACSNLTDMYCHAAEPPTFVPPAQQWNPTFAATPVSTATLHVPAESLPAYQNSDWNIFGNIVPIVEEQIIAFADPAVKEICVANWDTDGDGELSKEEAAVVTDLGSAFARNTEITSFNELKYFTGLTKIEGGTTIKPRIYLGFQNCGALSSITIPEGVTEIGANAFYGCLSLNSITIPENVDSIGESAFYNCLALETVSIGAGKKNISKSAFTRCNKLYNVFLNSNELTAREHENSPSMVSIFGSQVTNYQFGENVKKIGAGAFWNSTNLTSLYTRGITTIGDHAFYGCSGLAYIGIGTDLDSIGTRAFSGCGAIDNIQVSLGNTRYTDQDENGHDCNVIIDKVTGCLLSGCKNSTIPDYVTSIGEGAFSDCKELKAIALPDGLTEIGDEAFDGCSGMTELTFGGNVRKIGDHAFSMCRSLTSVTIPASVDSIGVYAFALCDGLTKAEYASIESLCKIHFSSLDANPLWHAHHLYIGGKEITNVVIPKSVSSITTPRAILTGCSFLESIVVESGNERYDSRNNCNAIIETGTNTLLVGTKATIIPNNVTSIAPEAFCGCTGLDSIAIPNNVKEIGELAFYDCANLTSVVIGNGVDSIGNWAFALCKNLKNVYCYAEDVPKAETVVFAAHTNSVNSALARQATLHVPAQSLTAYQTTSPWSDFRSIVPLTDEETAIAPVTTENADIKELYGPDGQRLSQMQKGLNIIRYANGATRKVMMK